MAFKRKTYSRLLDWKNSCQGKKALLVEGARRIGKSTIVEEFAKNEYESYILIDFNDVSDRVLKNFDENLSDLDTFFMLLSAEYGVTLKRRKSVIIFDEIQRFPKARQSIKKLVKDGRYDSDTFFWLGDSMIANECFNCNDPSIALAMNENRPAVKCYMGGYRSAGQPCL